MRKEKNMKKTRIKLTVISLLLLLAVAVNITGCALPVQAEDLMDGITPGRVEITDNMNEKSDVLTDFALRLFLASNTEGENTLISPLSVLYALAMTANGADGETRKEMESTLGMSVTELNHNLYTYLGSLAVGEKYKISIANSIWFTESERFTVNKSFLQTNADYYGADIYKAPFNRQTLRDINNWAKKETDGMIPKVLDEIPPEAIMYLVNALAFDAEWSSIYKKTQVRDGIFTTEDGSREDVELMYSTEGRYLDDGNATGFIKYYSGSKYAFVALLPNEGMSVEEYLATLNGESLHNLLKSPESATVKTALPKFESETSLSLVDALGEMGMSLAFSPTLADFSGIGTSTEGNIFIDDVIHKTYISVDERGTRAGAVTVVSMKDGSAAPDEIKTVYLDRPFVYMLIDCRYDIPFFIGTVMSVNG